MSKRHLVVVLGDQLNHDASAWDGFDPAHDVAWMGEAAEESTHVWSSKPRIAVFLSAMRHFAAELSARGVPLIHRRDEPTLAAALTSTLAAQRFEAVVMTQPGDWRVEQSLRAACAGAGVALDVRDDRHFLCSTAEFAAHAKGRKQLRMEYFYREMRKRHGVLMQGDEPEGGNWNYDVENRKGFGAKGPGLVPPPARFEPDEITRAVVDEVNDRYGSHPGSLDSFGWPVTRQQALTSLDAFVTDRLADFGTWQDAMWTGAPWLYHSHISAAMNLKLLDPREVIEAAEAAYYAGKAPLHAVEGFIRQVLGWREYVRGIYWRTMPGYVEMNALDAHESLPDWYWSGDVPMHCLHETLTQTFELGYAHHIQRLMITGLYALLLGVEPKQVHEWYLSVYIDAVEWVELPNTLGMSQFADGGLMASKPYIASGKYIDKMSDYCKGCRFDPAKRTGPDACPYTTLYSDFLLRHEKRFASHPRLALQVKNAARIDAAERRAIRQRALDLRAGVYD